MTKYIGYVSIVITLLGILIGGVTKFNFITARAEETAKKIEVVEGKIKEIEKEGNEKLEEITEENNQLDKNLTEMRVEQTYIKKSVDTLNENLKEFIKELKEEDKKDKKGKSK